MSVKKVRVNNEIRIPKVRVIDGEGEQIGIMSTDEALRLAQDRGLDLVEVAPMAKPPVCRIIDYGKFQYQQSKKAKELKKKQHTIQVKEIKLTPITEEHDFQFKLKHTQKFLNEGHKVKVTVRFRGRQLAHTDFGEEKLKRIAKEVEDIAVVERGPVMEGRNMLLILAPQSSTPEK